MATPAREGTRSYAPIPVERIVELGALARRAQDRIHATLSDTSVAPPAELEAVFEALAVAEEELLTQQEELGRTQLRAEEQLHRYHALFAHAPLPYIVTDDRGVIRDVNVSAATFFGRRVEHLRGKPLAALVPHDDRQSFRKALNGLRGAIGVEELSLRLVAPDGVIRELPAAVNIVHLPAPATEMCWLLLDAVAGRARDAASSEREIEQRVAERSATARRSVDELKEELAEVNAVQARAAAAEEATRRLLSVVSHELRTPLSAIAGYAEIVAMGLHGAITDDQRRDMEAVQRASGHMLALLDDLLSFFRMGAGRLQVEMDRVRVEDLLRGVETFVAPQAARRGITVRVNPGDMNGRVYCDIERARQVLINLFSNAVKFTPDNGEVALSWVESAADVLITVSDSGVGIPADQLANIFEPFNDVRQRAPVASMHGTGLGLAISRELARAMGGDLTAVSDGENGSSFTLRLARFDPPRPTG